MDRSHKFPISNGNRIFFIVLTLKTGIKATVLIPCSKKTEQTLFEARHLNSVLKITELKPITLFKAENTSISIFQLSKKSAVEIHVYSPMDWLEVPNTKVEGLVSYKGKP